MTINLNLVGTYSTGQFDESAAEIPAFDPISNRLFAVNAQAVTIDVLDLSDPSNPTKIGEIDASVFGGGANSVTVKNSTVAIAVEADVQTDNGQVLFFDSNSDFSNPVNPINSVNVGALPDNLTFTPDGNKVIVANEGEPDNGVDPFGSVSIIDISGGVNNATVRNLNFVDFNGREEDLRSDGVRIFPDIPAARDLEPEYIAVSADSTKAYVTLQENNAIAVVDIENATVEGILPLGLKDFNTGLPQLETVTFSDRPNINNGNADLVSSLGEQIQLGGFSGLWFDGAAPNGDLKFLTVPDRGPNDDAVGNDRPFLLPNYQARVVAFHYNPTTKDIIITNETLLTRSDGTTPITGLPNIPNVDRRAVDASGNPVQDDVPGLESFDVFNPGGTGDADNAVYDSFGADLEGIVRAPDGTFWMVDEYRPSIYHFASDGTLIDRFVPQGTADLANEENQGANFQVGDFGQETLPAEYLTRRANRGFEALALDTNNGILYSFIQTPLSNPDRDTGDESNVIRILGIDPTTGDNVAEYVYTLDRPDVGGNVDKIGDAVYDPANDKFYVIERDSGLESTSQKYIYEFNLTGATNLLANNAPQVPMGETLEQQTVDSLIDLGIQPVNKVRVANLPSLGYLPSDKPEGLALLDDGSLVVLNDNDFGLVPDAEAVELGIITFDQPNGLDPSDRDSGINIGNFPVFGMFMPDAIASYEVDGVNYFVVANEGDDRGEDERIADLELDPTAFPNAANLQQDEQLGRLGASTVDGDLDGDGDYDRLQVYGTRSFSIFDGNGNLVFDSGDAIEQIIATELPDFFNSNNDDNDSFEDRSDNKGPEPEGVIIGKVGVKDYAFIGLERVGGVLVYDISDPFEPQFVQYVNNRNFEDINGDVIPVELPDGSANPAAGDLGPEGFAFVSSEESPSGSPLLIVANEVSGTTSIFEIDPGFTPEDQPTQMVGLGDFEVTPVFTVGENLDDGTSDGYTPPGILDGLGAFALDSDTVRVLANHELTSDVGYAYTLANGTQLTGARVSFFDINKDTRELEDAGLAYDRILNRAGQVVDDPSDLEFGGINRLCSAQFIPANQFGAGMGLVNDLFFTGEETAGGTEFVLDPATNTMYAVPWMGRAAWESVTQLDTGTTNKVALLIGDDRGGAPLLLYVGKKRKGKGRNVLARNGLTRGKLYVWVADDGSTEPAQFQGTNTSRNGSFVEIDHYDRTQAGSAVDTDGDGSIQDELGYDAQGFATQAQQDALAQAAGAFAFSRPEDLATSPTDGTVAVLASTGRSSLFPEDSWGTTYKVDTDFSDLGNGNITARLDILYDGDDAGDGQFAGADFGLRSPDNLEWADDGLIYIQEDRSFGDFGLTSGEEASIWQLDPDTGILTRVAQMDRSAVPVGQTDGDPDDIGDWESSGIIDVSTLFDQDPGELFLFDVQAHSLQDGVIESEGLVEGGQLSFLQAEDNIFSLQVLHASDLEGGVDAVGRAANFAAIIDALEDSTSVDGSLTLSAGDNFLSGPFFSAAGEQSVFRDGGVFNDFYNQLFGTAAYDALREGGGRVDISIMNAIGFDASAIGNHEFDLGSATFGDLINEDFRDPAGSGGDRWVGANFPYLSANLDFSNDEELADLFTDEILTNTEFQNSPNSENPDDPDVPKIAPATLIETGGETIGVVGATTPLLESISSPTGTTVINGGSNDMNLLAGVLQPVIDDIIDGDDNVLGNGDDVNKVVLVSHLQQIALEQELAGLLDGVDIIIAGGSDTRLGNNDDTPRQGDTFDDQYPLVTTDVQGNPTVIVSTDGEYSYVGQLVVDFDQNGLLVDENGVPLADINGLDLDTNGPIATTDANVDSLWGNEDPFADGTKGRLVQDLTDAVSGVVTDQDSNIFGSTDVFIEGRRSFVRTEETTLGNLTADANLWTAQQADPSVVVSLKNGGGIRAAIGEVDPNGNLLPPQANPVSGKQEGEISQLDIENSLRFNNGLTLLTVTAEELVNILEYAVSATEDGATPGQFPQVGGLRFSFDPDGTPIELAADGSVITAGTRVQNLAIVDEDGTVLDVVIENGALVGNSDREIRLVTLDFLADGGDGYPFSQYGENVVQLQDLPQTSFTNNNATFADAGSEQDALAEYFNEFFSAPGQAFDQPETSPEDDTRIQNLDQTTTPTPTTVFGTNEADFFDTEVPDEKQFIGDNQILFAGGGNDQVNISFAPGGDRSQVDLGSGDDLLFGGTNHRIIAGSGNDTLFIGSGDGNNVITGGAGMDQFWIVTDTVDLPTEANTITDFTIGEDVIGFGASSPGLNFDDLELHQDGSDTIINALGQDLAILLRTQVSALSAADFAIV